MNPIRHPSNTRQLGAPVGWDQSGLPVEPLGVTDTVIGGVPCVLSFWQPDAVDLVNIAAGRPIGLSIVGRTMPPAALVTFDPDPSTAVAAPVARWHATHCRCADCIDRENRPHRESDAPALKDSAPVSSIQLKIIEAAEAAQKRALIDVTAERFFQDVQWGGSSHDDEHTVDEWHEYLCRQMDLLKFISHRPKEARERLVKIAALAVAGIESIDRKAGGAR